MSAAEYYNSGPDVARINTNLPPVPPPHSPSPAPTHSTVSPIKPYPHEPSFPPTHSAVGYNDDFFGRHHSTQSIDVDTAYHPPPPPPAGFSHNSSFSNDYDKQQPYNDGIPLHDTRPQYPLSSVESDQFGGGQPRPPYINPRKIRPWFCWFISTVQIAVFIAELVRNGVLTGSPIAIKPQINPMIGPSSQVLINMGARFVPCMKIIQGVTDQVGMNYPCPNSTTTTSNGCSLAQWCGFSGNGIPIEYGGTSHDTRPDQWWRFIVPIFLHAGIIHISFNMAFQLRIGVDMERELGILRFAICYFASGIFGFVLGGNFAPDGLLSTGCSGSLFGIIALLLLDLIWNWSQRPSPMTELLFLLLDIVIGFAIGLLPGLDNFSHIGGFLMGLILGIAVLHSPQSLRSKIGAGGPPYAPVAMHGGAAPGTGSGSGYTVTKHNAFLKGPRAFFKGRKPLWWAFWIVRAAMCAVALVVMIVLINNFFKYEKKCSWCKYLSCLPVSNWCDQGNLMVTTSTNTRRMLLRS